MRAVVRAGALQGFDAVAVSCGVDPVELRCAHGLDGVATTDPESMVSLAAVARMLDDAATRSDRPDFGLRVGAAQNPEMLGLLALVVSGAETVGDALDAASRYLFVHSPDYRLVREPARSDVEWLTLRFDVALDPDEPYRQLIDGCLASLFSLARALTGRSDLLRGVSLPHTPTCTRAAYEGVFGTPVWFAQPAAALHLRPEVLQVKLAGAQPEIHRRALTYLARRYPAPETSMSARVAAALRGTIGVSRGTKAEVAGLLGLHPRTLQRRLSAEGATFDRIREETYRVATHRLLMDTDLPLSEVAQVLGYSEHSALSRKVRVWYGTTPSEIRRSRGAGRRQSRRSNPSTSNPWAAK